MKHTTTIRMTTAKQMKLLKKLNQLNQLEHVHSVQSGQYGLFLLLRESLHADELKELGIDDRLVYTDHPATKLIKGILIEDLNNFLERNRKLASVRHALHQRGESETKLMENKKIIEVK